MRLVDTAVSLAAFAFTSACQAQPQDGWLILDLPTANLVAVDLGSVEESGTGVRLDAAMVSSEPVPLNGQQMTYLIAEIEFSCPVGTVETRYERRYGSAGLIEEGPTGLPPGQVVDQTLYARMAEAACVNQIERLGTRVVREASQLTRGG